MAKKILAGNWKLYKTPKEAREFFMEFNKLIDKAWEPNIVFFPSAIALTTVSEVLSGHRISFGPQNICIQNEGAFTGENSALHAKAVGARYVLIGHSERRVMFGESNANIHLKIKLTLEHGLIPVLCLGETLEERKSGQTKNVISQQLVESMSAISIEAPIVIAYEPVWAIGTGVVATPEQVEEAHAFLRQELKKMRGDKASEITLLYGGSVKPDNAAELIKRPNVDGFLVGGASLKPIDFYAIAKSCLG